MIKQLLSFTALAAVLLTSCVPARKLDECNEKRTACENELAALKGTNQGNEAKIKEMNEQLVTLTKESEGLRRDTGILGSNYRILTVKYDKLNQLNESLLDKYNKLLAGSERDNAKLSGDLQATQAALLKKEDELNALAAELAQKKKELEAREARVNELENILKQKDQAAADLQKKVRDALFAFENKGLTITQKNGKIYVSMDESLLFASGKTDVQPKGIEALKHLAKVLEQNADINIMVEGHTDDVPMKGSGDIKDNWDLSVMRATSVTKIILKHGPTIDPKRITSAGRGEFFPLDPGKTAEARKKNRRTEIILTPKLDELLKVLGSN